LPPKQAMQEQIDVTGNLVANGWVPVSTEVAGVIKTIAFTDGSLVRQGDLLVELDTSILAAELKQAEASYTLAQLRYQRQQRLLQSRSISQSVFDEAAAELDERRAVLEVAQVKLDKTRILAPFDGYVSLRTVSVGAYVTPGQAIVHVIDDTPLYVDFPVPARLATDIHPDDTVGFAIPEGADQWRRFQATVVALQPAVSPESRALTVRAIYPNRKRDLRAGSFARVQVPLGDSLPVLAVPEQSLVGTGDNYSVFVVIDGIAHRRDVKTGARIDGMIAIKSGLEENVAVVIAGLQRLAEGTAVKIVTVEEPAR